MSTPVFSVCVYCGARDGTDPAFQAAAEQAGRMLAAEGWRLVYGAGDVGLMGALAQAACAAGAPTLGVIPDHLLRTEALRQIHGQRIVTETMHERKKVMLMNSDAVLVLPGGAGTLDEFFEALTWRQLGLHSKPIIVLDVGDYWAPLTALIDGVIDRGFADAGLRNFIQVVGDVAAARDALRTASTE